MSPEVALAMLARDGRWLMQLRDDVPGIVAPGCWGLFGGHLDPSETPEQALRRELMEEINWEPGDLHYMFKQRTPRRTAYVFMGELTVPIHQLTLLEGQAMALVGRQELLTGSIWSSLHGAYRPLADGLLEVMRLLLDPSVAPD